ALDEEADVQIQDCGENQLTADSLRFHATISDQVRQFRAADYHCHRCSGGHTRAAWKLSSRLGAEIAIAFVLEFVARAGRQHPCRGIFVQGPQGTDSLL